MQGVKEENTANEICHGCLSNDRRVSGLCEYLETYKVVIASRKNLIYGIDNIRVCWECKAMLKKFKLFQQRLHAAQDALTLMFYQVEYHPATLSKLSTVNNYYYNHDYQHIESTIDNKEDVDMVVEPATELGFCIKEESNIDDEYIDDLPENKDEVELNYVDNVDLPPENDMKPAQAKGRMLVQSSDKLRHKHVKYCKQYAILIPRTDWGKLGNHFSMTKFGEAEMEEHLLSKERKLNQNTGFNFKCDICQLGYMRKDDLKRHNDLNHGGLKKTIKCSLCNKRQSSLTSLELHWRTHTIIAQCKMCKDYCRRSGMKTHLNQSHSHRYACPYCNMTFGKIFQFSVHYKEMHQKFICDYCNKICKAKKSIEKHIRNNHTQMTCKKCNRTFSNNKQYKNHCYNKHPRDTSRPELAYCVECNIQYDTLNKYKNHLKTSPRHADIERFTFPCTVCGKIFRIKSSLNNHFSFYHAKNSKHYCESCDKYYSSNRALKQHTADVHMKVEKVKDKICDLCGRGFSTNRILLNHRRTHTGERPYQCPHCTASFIQRFAMVSHCKTQHKDVK